MDLPTGAQVLGVVAALVGLFLLAGVAWALLVGGIGVAVVGYLAESPTRTEPRSAPSDRRSGSNDQGVE